MKDDIRFMKEALQEAECAKGKEEVPVGCIVVRDNRIIARAHNLTEMLNDVTAHAEIQAITSASEFLGGKYLTGCSLYVTLEPCVMCAGALYWSQISRVIIGARDKKRGFMEKRLSLHPKTKIEVGILETDSLRYLRDFFEEKRKKKKW
ncbi:MAG: nucleoside deaminase [Bergeyella sp.]|nr:nucleoside deaminase [Bergeyella sp.]